MTSETSQKIGKTSRQKWKTDGRTEQSLRQKESSRRENGERVLSEVVVAENVGRKLIAAPAPRWPAGYLLASCRRVGPDARVEGIF